MDIQLYITLFGLFLEIKFLIQSLTVRTGSSIVDSSVGAWVLSHFPCMQNRPPRYGQTEKTRSQPIAMFLARTESSFP